MRSPLPPRGPQGLLGCVACVHPVKLSRLPTRGQGPAECLHLTCEDPVRRALWERCLTAS